MEEARERSRVTKRSWPTRKILWWAKEELIAFDPLFNSEWKGKPRVVRKSTILQRLLEVFGDKQLQRAARTERDWIQEKIKSSRATRRNQDAPDIRDFVFGCSIAPDEKSQKHSHKYYDYKTDYWEVIDPLRVEGVSALGRLEALRKAGVGPAGSDVTMTLLGVFTKLAAIGQNRQLSMRGLVRVRAYQALAEVSNRLAEMCEQDASRDTFRLEMNWKGFTNFFKHDNYNMFIDNLAGLRILAKETGEGNEESGFVEREQQRQGELGAKKEAEQDTKPETEKSSITRDEIEEAKAVTAKMQEPIADYVRTLLKRLEGRRAANPEDSKWVAGAVTELARHRGLDLVYNDQVVNLEWQSRVFKARPTGKDRKPLVNSASFPELGVRADTSSHRTV